VSERELLLFGRRLLRRVVQFPVVTNSYPVGHVGPTGYELDVVTVGTNVAVP
jgi:hypothetical protein